MTETNLVPIPEIAPRRDKFSLKAMEINNHLKNLCFKENKITTLILDIILNLEV